MIMIFWSSYKGNKLFVNWFKFLLVLHFSFIMCAETLYMYTVAIICYFPKVYWIILICFALLFSLGLWKKAEWPGKENWCERQRTCGEDENFCFSWVNKLATTEVAQWSVRALPLWLKLQPAIFVLSKHVIRFHELPDRSIQCILQQGF